MRGPYRYLTLLCIIFTFDSAFSKVQDGGLYKPSDLVTKLTDTTFNALTGKTFKINWLIQFYHSSCGHCINFSRHFKKFAKDVYSWRDTVKIGVLDCRFYGPICRKNTKSIPRLLLYQAGQDRSSAKNVTSVFNALGLTKNLVEALSFEPFLKPKKKESFDTMADKSVVIADPNGLLAKEIILDLRYVGKPLYWVMGKYEAGELTVVESPSKPAAVTMLVVMNGRLNLLQSDIETRGAARRAIKAVWGDITRPGESATDSGGSDGKVTKYIPKTAKYPQFGDIYSAISMAFRKDVPLKRMIQGEDMVTLKNMLRVVTEYLHQVPTISSHDSTFESIAKMFTKLEKKVENVSSIKADDWTKEYDAAVPMPRTENWIFCSGSKSFFRGYPCGLWTLFHSLTVMNCVKNPHLSAEKSRFLLLTVKKFVFAFFSCRHCAKNFMKETVALEKSFNSTCGAMIWLWKVHNSVNERLAGKPSEDPKYPKIQFPPTKLCSSCREDSETLKWNVEEVGRFLPTFFTPKHFGMKSESKMIAFATAYNQNGSSSASKSVANAIIRLTVSLAAVAIIAFV